jgi:type IV pilus assembly protein PilM
VQQASQADAHTMGELVGLALRASGPCPVEVELIPDAVEKSREAKSRAPLLIVAGLCLWGLGAAGLVYFKKADEAVKDKLAEVQKRHDSMVDASSEITRISNELEDLKGQGAQLQSAVNDRAYWIRLLSVLNQSFSNDFIWLTAIEPIKNGQSLAEPLTDQLKQATTSGSLVEGVSAGALFSPPKLPEAVTQAGGTTTIAAVDAGDNKWQLRILGLYRKNPEGQQVVYDYVRRLAELTEFFDKANINVTDKLNDYCKAELGESDDRYAYKFEIRLPLAQSIQFAK